MPRDYDSWLLKFGDYHPYLANLSLHRLGSSLVHLSSVNNFILQIGKLFANSTRATIIINYL